LLVNPQFYHMSDAAVLERASHLDSSLTQHGARIDPLIYRRLYAEESALNIEINARNLVRRWHEAQS
jgi:hypothetical protein